MLNSAPKIGLRQAKALCQMSHVNRLKFIADGLPIILSSAQGYWNAACHLKEQPREAIVLRGHAVEEAAKILILMDSVRCPKKIIPSKIGNIVKWFYDHLARLIYAESIHWRPFTVKDLRRHVDSNRLSHYVEGSVGELIVPNWNLFLREGRMYVDIFQEENEEPYWFPLEPMETNFPPCEPLALKLSKAMSALGMFSVPGLMLTAEVWDQITFTNNEDYRDASLLVRQLLEKLVNRKLPTTEACQEDVETLHEYWQLPMYDFEFSFKNASLEQLREEQEHFWASEIF